MLVLSVPQASRSIRSNQLHDKDVPLPMIWGQNHISQTDLSIALLARALTFSIHTSYYLFTQVHPNILHAKHHPLLMVPRRLGC